MELIHRAFRMVQMLPESELPDTQRRRWAWLRPDVDDGLVDRAAENDGATATEVG